MYRIKLKPYEAEYMCKVFGVKINETYVSEKWTEWFKGQPGDEGADSDGRQCRFVVEKWITSVGSLPTFPVKITKRWGVKFFNGEKECI